MHNKTVLITGITGFIGCHLMKYLKCTYPSCRIIGISRYESKQDNVYQVDLLKQDEVDFIINKIKPDYLFHLSGLVFSYNWDDLYKGNVTITLHLLESIKKHDLKTHVVITGSSAEYGCIDVGSLPVTETYSSIPHTPYGMTKYWQTMVAKYYQSYGLHVTIARLFNIIGVGVSPKLMIGDILLQLNKIIQQKQDPQIIVGNLSVKRDFLDIDDVCSGLVAIATSMKFGLEYNLCSGYSSSFKDILDLAIVFSGLKVDIVIDQNKPQNAYLLDIFGCNAKIQQDTHWKPRVKVIDSIKKFLNSHELVVC